MRILTILGSLLLLCATLLLFFAFTLPAQAVSNCDGAGSPLPDVTEMQVVMQVNAYRESYGLQDLVVLPVLENAARYKAHEMEVDRNPEHDEPFRSWEQRFFDCAIWDGTSMAGENIGAGQLFPTEIVSDWQHSPGHNANLLNPAYRYAGIAFLSQAMTPATSGSWPTFWVMEYAEQP